MLVNEESLERDSKEKFAVALVTMQLFIRHYPGPVPRIKGALVKEK